MGEENERVDAVMVRMLWWDRKIDVIKLVREMTGLGSREAMGFIEHLPQTVKADISEEEGWVLKRRFDELGAFIDMRPSSRTPD